MYNKQAQLTLEENFLYQILLEGILAQFNRLINWEPFEKILAKLHSSPVGRPAYEPDQGSSGSHQPRT